jgi:hypothetical protein
VIVYHGPCVETRGQWCAEAVWAGEFTQGDFDRTDLVFGTGVRCRGDRVTFVSSGSMLDRLCHAQRGDAWYVANSLPALLATAGLSLRADYAEYAEDMKRICGGLKADKRPLPADSGEVHLVYFNDLVYDGETLREIEKTDAAFPLASFADYGDFLVGTAARLGVNMTDAARGHTITPLATVSSGYDSGAAAVIAKRAGCADSVTFKQSASLWRGSDSGAEVARHLGLACKTYNRMAKQYPLEETIWSVTGRPGILNWVLFDYPEPLCLLFTACHGDKMWDRAATDLPDPFAMPSVAELGFGEFRLFKGVFHCPVPYWGMRHIQEIRRISFLEAMEPWVLHTPYDRPIPRRLLEEAGVPRGSFAVRKKNTSHEATFLWPYSPASQARFRTFLESRGVRPPSPITVRLWRTLSWMATLMSVNALSPLGLDRLGIERMVASRASDLLFCWANDELRKTYAEALKSAGGRASEPDFAGGRSPAGSAGCG